MQENNLSENDVHMVVIGPLTVFLSSHWLNLDAGSDIGAE